MGKPCDPKNNVPKIRAMGQIQGDIFSEAERVKNFSGEQRFYYEKVMANHFGIKVKQPKGRSAWDAIPKNKKNPLADGMNYDRPSQLFSKKFYGGIDKRLNAFEKGKDKSMDAYREQVGNPVKGVLRQLDSDIKMAKNNADLNRRLAKWGLTSKTLYHGKEYLEWLAKGGHMQQESNKWIKGLNQGGSNLAKAQSGFQMLWTLGNGVDMQRVYSHYVTRRPSSIVNVAKGTVDAIKATKGQPWRRIPELEKAGVYGSEVLGQGGKNISPFEMSITAQKNLTYFLDKANGGNGINGIRDLLFDSKPWDRPLWDRPHADAQLLFGLARYPINESRWLIKTAMAAKTDKREAANLLIYGMSRAFTVGSASVIPSWLLDEEQKEWFAGMDEKLNLNQLRSLSKEVFKSMGIDAELNLADYLSPLGGKLGSRAGSLTTTGEKAGRNVAKSVTDAAQGNIPAAGVRAAGAVSAIANLTNWGKAVKLLGGVNSTQATDLSDTLAKQMEGEFKTQEQFKREAAKDLFGSAVKKSEGGNGLHKLPALPKLPALK